MKSLLSDIWQILSSKIGLLYLVLCVGLSFQLTMAHVYIMCVFVCMCIIYLIFNLNGRIDNTTFIIIIFTLVYWAINFLNGYHTSPVVTINSVFSPIVFYLFGKMLVLRLGNERTLQSAILIFIICNCIKYFIITGTMINQNGFIGTGRIFANDYIQGDEKGAMDATLVACNVAVSLSGISIFLAYNRRLRNFKAWLFLIVAFCGIIVNLNLINRTGVYLSIICLLSTVLYLLRKNRTNTIVGLLFITSLLFLVFDTSFEEQSMMLSAYESRNNGDAGALGGRWVIWGNALNMLISHPMGWSSVNSVGFAHNMWLDIARQSGWIPFVLLICVSIAAYKPILSLIKIKNSPLVATLLSLTVCLSCYAFIEPLSIGAPMAFNTLFLIWGITRQINDSNDFCWCSQTIESNNFKESV